MKKQGSDSYEEIVLRRQGGPVPGRGARRRGAAEATEAPEAEGAPRVVTDSHPQAVTARAVQLTRLAGRLNVPGVSADKLRELAAGTDEQIGFWTPVLSDLVEGVPAAGAIAKTSAPELDERLAQRTELSLLRGTAAQVRSDVKDSRRQTGAELRQGMRMLAEKIRADLQPNAMGQKEQDRLRSHAQEFLRLWEKVEAGPATERDKTLQEEAAHAQALAAEEDRTEALRAVVKLRGGEPLGQDEWDRAAAYYDSARAGLDEDGAEDDNNRRARTR